MANLSKKNVMVENSIKVNRLLDIFRGKKVITNSKNLYFCTAINRVALTSV